VVRKKKGEKGGGARPLLPIIKRGKGEEKERGTSTFFFGKGVSGAQGGRKKLTLLMWCGRGGGSRYQAVGGKKGIMNPTNSNHRERSRK